MVSLSLAMVAATALWVVVYLFLLSGLQHARSQHMLYATFRAELAQAQIPTGGQIPAGKPVAMISVPSAGLKDEIVVEGTSSGQLRTGPGHLRTSPLPGQPGDATIYGKSISYGAPFARVSSLKPGADITVTTGQGVFQFVVIDVRKKGDLQPAQTGAGSSRLTLATAGGSQFAPTDAIFVDAALKGKAAAASGGRPSAITAPEDLMKQNIDAVTLIQLVLWLQLIVVVSCGIVWLAPRWSRSQVWLVAAPVLIAALWELTTTAANLLPNVM